LFAHIAVGGAGAAVLLLTRIKNFCRGLFFVLPFCP
jgi:hypothetical protein